MPSAKKPPIKLVWFEHVTDWLADKPPPFPEGVSRPGMSSVVAMILRATRSETNEAMVAARWVERMTGVNQGAVARAMDYLEASGWLMWTQRRVNRVKVYEITIPLVLTDTQHSGPSADASADSGADDYSDTPGTPGTPLEDFIEGEDAWGACNNCGIVDGHDVDCAHRPFEAASS